MSTKIEFEYEDKKYVLEYSRDSIKYMERAGFDINKYSENPITMIELAFQGAFLKNHKTIKNSLIGEIYDNIGDKTTLNNKLIEMIMETYNSLMDDPEEDKTKKIEWKIV